MRRLFPATAILMLPAVAAVPAADAASRVTIRGAGFGHGVGMSQYGAMGFAKHGSNYRSILMHYYSKSALARLDRNPTIRVLLQSGRSSVSFSGASKVGTKKLKPATTYRAAVAGAGRVALFTSGGKRVGTFTAPLRASAPRGAAVSIAGAGSYRGAVEVRPSTLGGLNAINAVNLEDYVRGVVARESPSSWPLEALKAQAVAARTYAITTTKGGAGWDHYPDTRSQVYGGVAAETESTDTAIRATRREVVTYDGEPVVTYFFSTSGGRTENVENSLGGEPKPWLKSVSDPYDDESPRHKWRLRMSVSRAQSKLSGLVKGKLRSIKVTKRGVSPRIVRASIVGSRGRTTVSGATLRARFGLNDTWAYFKFVGTKAKSGGGKQPARKSGDPGSGTGGVSAARVRRGGVVSGYVRPSRDGSRVAIQRRTQAGVWVVELRTTIGAGGRFRATVTRPGRYRVKAPGVIGPVVRVR